jgi:polysaccharide pyruvyl transferase WcaK-like protein
MSQKLSQVVPDSPDRDFRVGIMGTPIDAGNRGVLALASSLVKLISEARPDAAISFLIPSRNIRGTEMRAGHGWKTVDTVNYRLSPRAPINQHLGWILCLSLIYRLLPSARARDWIAGMSSWIRFTTQADFIGDIRGGDSFSDIYGTTQFVRGCLPVLSVIWVRKGIHLFPQTYGPFRSPIARMFARYILLRAESIWCRDRAGLQEVLRLTNGRRSASVCPDVAFALDSVSPKSLSTDPPLRKQDRETLIGVNVNGLMYHGGYTRANMFGLKLDYSAFLRRLLEQLLASESNRVLLIPHTFAPEGRVESDPAASRELMRSLPPSLRNRVHLVDTEYDQHEIKGIIGLCDFFVGSRMHACIAALSQGIPTIAVAYSRKFSGVFEMVGAADSVIDGRTENAEQALSRVAELFDRRDMKRAALRERVGAAQRELQRMFEQLLDESGAQLTSSWERVPERRVGGRC